jgi:hypothetical protein
MTKTEFATSIKLWGESPPILFHPSRILSNPFQILTLSLLLSHPAGKTFIRLLSGKIVIISVV